MDGIFLIMLLALSKDEWVKYFLLSDKGLFCGSFCKKLLYSLSLHFIKLPAVAVGSGVKASDGGNVDQNNY